MLEKLLIIILVILVLALLLLVYSCFVVAGRSDRLDEELFTQHQIGDLSDLEKMTLESLLKAYEEDGISFIVNDGEIVNYEVDDCEDFGY